MPQRSRFEQWPKPQHLACCKFPFPNKTVLTTLKNTNFLAQFTSVGLADRALARVFVRARFLKDPVLPITHCALTIIGGHFLDVEKSEN